MSDKKKIVSSMVVTITPGHDHIKIFNRGFTAGEITVEVGDGQKIADALSLVNCDPVELLQYALDKLGGEPIPPAETKLAAHFDAGLLEAIKKLCRLSARYTTTNYHVLKEVFDLLEGLRRSTVGLVEKLKKVHMVIDETDQIFNKALDTKVDDTREVFAKVNYGADLNNQKARRLVEEIIDGFDESQGEEKS